MDKRVGPTSLAETWRLSKRAFPVFVRGTQTAQTGAWTGVAPFAALEDGQQISYWLPFPGSGNATLDLTLSDGSTTGAVPCYYGASSRLTTHYGGGNIIRFVYRANVSINGSSTKYTGWWADANYDTNDGDAHWLTYPRRYAGAYGPYQYSLVMQDTSGNWQSLTTSAGTGTSKAANTALFRAGQKLWYHNSGSNRSAGVLMTDWGSFRDATPVFDLRYSTNCATGLTANRVVYLVGTVSGGAWSPCDVWWTQSEPAQADGKVYIRIGEAYDTYRVNLELDNAWYAWQAGEFRRWYAVPEATTDTHGTVMPDGVTLAVDSGTGKLTVQNMSPSAFLSAYPIGAYYMTTDSRNPHEIYGGYWESVGGNGPYLWKRIAPVDVIDSDAFLQAHPIGSYLMTDSSTNPSTYGGTWANVVSTGAWTWRRTA